MTPPLLYLLKVVLGSGILLGYYALALRNRTFHQWNRFYLLGSVVLSLAAPLVTINISFFAKPEAPTVIRLLRVVDGNADEVVTSNPQLATITFEQVFTLVYVLISTILLAIIVFNAVRIYAVLRGHAKTKIGNVYFLPTQEAGAPFTFFNYIIWNNAIDLQTEAGQRIFKHELAHVTGRHTWDKIFLLLVLVPFWVNPFFWMIRREVTALHEFEADKKALDQCDASALAQLILNTAFPNEPFLFTTHFFQSPIKRRLAMFTKLKHPTVTYFSRIAALPLLVVVIASFAATKTVGTGNAATSAQPLTVVIDAGHGGGSGAHWEAIYEDDIVLSLARKIKDLNKNDNVKIILSRENNQLVNLNNRVQFAKEKKADLFISLHVNTANTNAKTPETGMQVMVSSKNPPYQQSSKAFASLLVQALTSAFTTQQTLANSGTGIFVLDKTSCAAVLLHCGYLTNATDRAFISQEKNQVLVANKILAAIEQYGVLKNVGAAPANDTVPNRKYRNKEVTDVQYFEWPEKKVELTFTDNTKEAITVEEALKANLFNAKDKALLERRAVAPANGSPANMADGNVSIRTTSPQEASKFTGVILLDEKIIVDRYDGLPSSKKEGSKLYFLKANSGTLLQNFGVDIKDGDSILMISTKAAMAAGQQRGNDRLFTKTEVPPSFPTEDGGWQAFLQKNLNANVAVNNAAPPNTYKVEVQFIVDNYGKLHDIKPLTKNGYGMEDEVVRLLKTSPDWIPAKQNGKVVTAYHKQPVTFVIAEE